MRVRVRHSKTGKLRFISAIDLGRVWERALRKADLPIAYSEGFSPHPKVSFVDALPLGLASVAELAELTFAGPVPLDVMTQRLNAAFPEGIAVLDAVEAPDGAARLGKLTRASLWEVTLPDEVDGAAAARRLLDADALLVERERKGEDEVIDVQPAVAGATGRPGRLRLLLHHADAVPVERPVNVRPDDVVAALAADGAAPPRPHLITRLAQGVITDDGLVEALSQTVVPLEPDSSPPPPVHAPPQESAGPDPGGRVVSQEA